MKQYKEVGKEIRIRIDELKNALLDQNDPVIRSIIYGQIRAYQEAYVLIAKFKFKEMREK